MWFDWDRNYTFKGKTLFYDFFFYLAQNCVQKCKIFEEYISDIYMNTFSFCWRQDIPSSSAVPTQPTPTPVFSRSRRSSCCCWTACGSCGVSSPWLWASLRRCSWGWPLRPTPLTTAPSCVTAIGRGRSPQIWNPTSFKPIWFSSSLSSLTDVFWEWWKTLTVCSKPC